MRGHPLIESQRGGELPDVARGLGVAAETVLRPDLDPGQGADGDDVPLDLGVLTVGGRDDEPALGVARYFLCMGEKMAHEPAIAFVLGRGGLEPRAELSPRDRRVERQARVGLGDGQEEAGAQPFAKACGNDKTALIVKAMFD